MQYWKFFIVLMFFFIMGFASVIDAKTEKIYSYYIPTLAPKVIVGKMMPGNLESVLGEGWSSDNNIPVGQCLQGTVDHVGTPSGSVAMDKIYNYDEIMNQLNLKKEADFSILGF